MSDDLSFLNKTVQYGLAGAMLAGLAGVAISVSSSFRDTVTEVSPGEVVDSRFSFNTGRDFTLFNFNKNEMCRMSSGDVDGNIRQPFKSVAEIKKHGVCKGFSELTGIEKTAKNAALKLVNHKI